jgi:hypothetical protein
MYDNARGIPIRGSASGVAVSRWTDHYVNILAVALLGYAIFGKTFAYLGLPPLFIGEITLLLGLLALLQSGCLFASLASFPSIILGIAMGWVLLRTLPYLGTYGFDAARDSVVIMYGVFAFIVVGLLLEKPLRVFATLRLYSKFAAIFVPAAPLSFILSGYFGLVPPTLFLIRPGEAAVHLAGVSVFAMVGFRRMGAWSIIAVVLTAAMVSSISRGGALAFIVPTIVAALLTGRVRLVGKIATACLMLLAVAYVVEEAAFDGSADLGRRSVSAHQLVANATSIFVDSGEPEESTKEWRLRWWSIIFADTLHGPHFWTGRGFGLNLADADGFADGINVDGPPLRSPHNAHMTNLARAGVPGLVLWVLVLLTWFGTIVTSYIEARMRGQPAWAALFMFVGCYQLAMIINASFDVALEGPMLGIWFWCLYGFGIGSAMVYRVAGTPAPHHG